ncbi:hypothetical protein BBK36DRAFT_1172805 [Trichoderma citrinoviride]|uniref:Rhodopsin domain-containing protein n=1 Tax=Trichoderma citrinoviride TaxID=58853 RepID=A0A2T4AYU6_9HYPO|nr:hypothetical protein BBK36DRAFT_1172805 [Trichoderma citrinoviride]PTB62249.1 hypothetical protein BBK36DRAFT_1172805 [Trichoderma citrinoviride]
MATNSTLSPEYLAESKTQLVTTMYAVPIALETVSTAWRLWAAATAQSGFAYADYLMLFATLVAIAECVTGLVYGPPFGLGRHVEAVPKHNVQMFLKGDYIFSHFYDIAIASTKLSILALYHRIFVTRPFRLVVVATACFVCAWLVVMEVVLGFGCRPIQAWWDETRGTCIDKEAFTYFTNVTNMVTDLWIFMMPIPVILGLQAAQEKRLILCFMFGVGLATCAISAARLSFVFGVASADFTWDEASFGILSAWEPCGAILCANLPPIYRHLVVIRDTLRAGVRSVVTHSHSHPRSAATEEVNGSDRGRGGYKGSLQHHDWAKLNRSDGLTGETTSRTVTEVCAQKGPGLAVDLEELQGGGIMVQRAFTQHSRAATSSLADEIQIELA